MLCLPIKFSDKCETYEIKRTFRIRRPGSTYRQQSDGMCSNTIYTVPMSPVGLSTSQSTITTTDSIDVVLPTAESMSNSLVIPELFNNKAVKKLSVDGNSDFNAGTGCQLCKPSNNFPQTQKVCQMCARAKAVAFDDVGGVVPSYRRKPNFAFFSPTKSVYNPHTKNFSEYVENDDYIDVTVTRVVRDVSDSDDETPDHPGRNAQPISTHGSSAPPKVIPKLVKEIRRNSLTAKRLLSGSPKKHSCESSRKLLTRLTTSAIQNLDSSKASKNYAAMKKSTSQPLNSSRNEPFTKQSPLDSMERLSEWQPSSGPAKNLITSPLPSSRGETESSANSHMITKSRKKIKYRRQIAKALPVSDNPDTSVTESTDTTQVNELSGQVSVALIPEPAEESIINDTHSTRAEQTDETCPAVDGTAHAADSVPNLSKDSPSYDIESAGPIVLDGDTDDLDISHTCTDQPHVDDQTLTEIFRDRELMRTFSVNSNRMKFQLEADQIDFQICTRAETTKRASILRRNYHSKRRFTSDRQPAKRKHKAIDKTTSLNA